MTSHITLILPGKECRIVHICTTDVFFNERPLLISVNFHYLNYFCLKKVAVYFFYTYFTVPIVEIFKKKMKYNSGYFKQNVFIVCIVSLYYNKNNSLQLRQC